MDNIKAIKKSTIKELTDNISIRLLYNIFPTLYSMTESELGELYTLRKYDNIDDTLGMIVDMYISMVDILKDIHKISPLYKHQTSSITLEYLLYLYQDNKDVYCVRQIELLFIYIAGLYYTNPIYENTISEDGLDKTITLLQKGSMLLDLINSLINKVSEQL